MDSENQSPTRQGGISQNIILVEEQGIHLPQSMAKKTSSSNAREKSLDDYTNPSFKVDCNLRSQSAINKDEYFVRKRKLMSQIESVIEYLDIVQKHAALVLENYQKHNDEVEVYIRVRDQYLLNASAFGPLPLEHSTRKKLKSKNNPVTDVTSSKIYNSVKTYKDTDDAHSQVNLPSLTKNKKNPTNEEVLECIPASMLSKLNIQSTVLHSDLPQSNYNKDSETEGHFNEKQKLKNKKPQSLIKTKVKSVYGARPVTQMSKSQIQRLASEKALKNRPAFDISLPQADNNVDDNMEVGDNVKIEAEKKYNGKSLTNMKKNQNVRLKNTNDIQTTTTQKVSCLPLSEESYQKLHRVLLMMRKSSKLYKQFLVRQISANNDLDQFDPSLLSLNSRSHNTKDNNHFFTNKHQTFSLEAFVSKYYKIFEKDIDKRSLTFSLPNTQEESDELKTEGEINQASEEADNKNNGTINLTRKRHEQYYVEKTNKLSTKEVIDIIKSLLQRLDSLTDGKAVQSVMKLLKCKHDQKESSGNKKTVSQVVTINNQETTERSESVPSFALGKNKYNPELERTKAIKIFSMWKEIQAVLQELLIAKRIHKGFMITMLKERNKSKNKVLTLFLEQNSELEAAMGIHAMAPLRAVIDPLAIENICRTNTNDKMKKCTKLVQVEGLHSFSISNKKIILPSFLDQVLRDKQHFSTRKKVCKMGQERSRTTRSVPKIIYSKRTEFINKNKNTMRRAYDSSNQHEDDYIVLFGIYKYDYLHLRSEIGKRLLPYLISYLKVTSELSTKLERHHNIINQEGEQGNNKFIITKDIIWMEALKLLQVIDSILLSGGRKRWSALPPKEN